MGQSTVIMIIISAYPRLHVTLIAMNNLGYRINGGIGFAIDNPSISFSASPSDEFELVDNRDNKLEESQLRVLKNLIDSIKLNLNFCKNVSIAINGEMPTHSGFGSGTIVRLSCIEALYQINNVEYTEDKIISLSGRGGTSGIGVRTYFHGGFVFDIGHKKSSKILPSNMVEDLHRNSLLVENGKMPNWEIGICIPKDMKSISQMEEQVFFKNTIPISNASVFETLYHVVYGLYAAIKENDIYTFSKALKELQDCHWKYSERGLYGEKIKQYESILYNCGALSVGMSSLGPCLFFTADNINSVIENVSNSQYSNNLTLLKSNALNRGRIVSI